MAELSQIERDGAVYDLKDILSRQELAKKVDYKPWRLLMAITTDEEVSVVESSVDVNGNEFSVTEIYVAIAAIANEAKSTSTFIKVDNVFSPIAAGSHETKRRLIEFYAELIREYNLVMIKDFRTGVESWNQVTHAASYQDFIQFAATNTPIEAGGAEPLTTIRITNTVPFGVGSRFVVLGR